MSEAKNIIHRQDCFQCFREAVNLALDTIPHLLLFQVCLGRFPDQRLWFFLKRTSVDCFFKDWWKISGKSDIG